MIDQPHRLAARRRRGLGEQGVEALIVAGEDDHAAELDRDGKGVARPRGDRSDQPEQGLAQAGHLAPVLVDHRQQDLSARFAGLAVLAHRIDDREACCRGDRARTGERRIPAHRIAGDRGDVETRPVDVEEIGVGGGEDERRGDVAARMGGDAEPVGAVQRRNGRLAAFGAHLIDDFDQRRFVGVQALQIAELGLAVASPSRADDQRGQLLNHATSPSSGACPVRPGRGRRRRSNRGSAGSRSPPGRAE